MSALTDDTLPVTPRAMRDEMIVFAAMAVLLAIVPLTGIYPFFVMQALCFALLACAFNLLIGYGCSDSAGCCRSAMRCSWAPPATSRRMR